jgi:superfamily II helicase
MIHVSQHQGTRLSSIENTVDHLVEELGWDRPEAERAVKRAQEHGWIRVNGPTLELTESGLSVVRSIL